MGEEEQAKPLAAAGDRISSDEEEAAFLSKKLHRKKCIKCCGCITALLLIQAVVIIILAFTVFRVRDPKIKLNAVHIDKLVLINATTPAPGINMTLTADVSVKNPNIASFKFSNTSTTLYYRGNIVGEARNGAGRAKARKTMRMNVTVEMIPDRLLGDPNLKSDINTGLLTMNSYTVMGGRVNMLNLFKKHVTIRMNCSMTVNISSQAIQEQKCKRRVKL